jgi:hypothetical protein
VRELGWGASEAAEAAGVSVRTVRKWLARDRAEGALRLLDRPSRPRNPPPRIAEGWQALIVRLRHCRMTAQDIASRLHLARSTVAAELVRLGLSRLSALAPKSLCVATSEPGWAIWSISTSRSLPASTSPAIALPGPGAARTTASVGSSSNVCIDDHARLAYVEVLNDEAGDSCARFLARAVVWFARRGICVRRVLTDNGTGYRSHLFRQAREALGLRHLRTRPYTPKTNGKAERFIKTMLEDWAYAIPYRSSGNRRRQLPVWLRHYNNHERPHGSLASLPPASRPRLG